MNDGVPASEDMLLNFDGWLGRQNPETRAAVNQHLTANPENADREKRKLASMSAVADATGLDLGTVNDRWDTIRGGFAEQKGGQWVPAKDDEGAFNAQLVKEATQQRDERHLVFGLDDRKAPDFKDAWDASLASRAQEAAYGGKTFADALAEWQDTAKAKPGFQPERSDFHEQVARQYFDRVQTGLEKVRPIAEQAFQQISAARGATEGQGNAAPFELFRGLTPDEKQLAFRVMSDRAGGGDKSRTQAFFEAVGRGFENLTAGATAGGQRSILLNTKFKEGQQVFANDPLTQIQPMQSKSEFGFGQRHALTADEAKTWNEKLSASVEDLDTAEQLRKFGQDVIDPTNKTGGFLFRKLVIPAADSAALMAGMSIPGIWPLTMAASANSYQNDEYAQLREQGMDSAQANRVAAVTGAAQAALDKVEVGILGRGIPATRNILDKFALSGGALKRFAANAAGTLLAETAVELTQDHIIPALVQDNLASDPEFDVKWSDVWSEVAKATPDTAMGMVLLSGLGGIVQTREQSQFVKEFSASPSAMRTRGYSLDQIKEIQAAPLPERGALLAQYLPVKAPEGAEREKLVSEAVKLATEEKATFDAQAQHDAGESADAADYAIRVTRGDAGWEITKPDGKTLTVDSAEAARRIRGDLVQAATQEEADALVSIVDTWHGNAPEGTSRETVLTGETAQMTGGKFTKTPVREDAVREVKDAATLDALSEEARMDARMTGNEEIDVLVNGQNSIEFREKVADGAATIVQRLELNQSASTALTALHEQAEAAWRTGIATGAITVEETRAAIASIASVFDPSLSRDEGERAFRERLQRVAKGSASDVETRETVSELAVADAIAKRRDGGSFPAGAVSKSLNAAIANAKDAGEVRTLGKFRAFLRSAKAHFRAVLGTVAALRKAKREGKGAEFQALIEKITGTDAQANHYRALAGEIGNYVPPTAEEQAAGIAFSVTPGNELTQEEQFSNWLRTAADKPSQLRVPDVDRVMSYAKDASEVAAVRKWLLGQPILEDAKTEVRNWTSDEGFSLSPGKRIELIQKRIDAALADDPERRRQLGREASRKLERLKSNMETERLTPLGDRIRPLVEQRTTKQLDKEQATRAALREKELVDEGMAKLSPATLSAYEHGVTKLEEDPFVFAMLENYGKLLSKTQAAKQGKYGEYDGSPSLPSRWYSPSGGLMPDEMASAMADGGHLREGTPEALWDALRRAITTARNANKQFKEAEKAVSEIEKQAKNQARETAYEWRQQADAEQAKDQNPKARLVRDLRTLDAILSVLPAEVRGKVGGFVKLATLGSDEARLKEFETRIEKISGLVERHLKKEYGDAFKELLERAKPKVEAAGKKKIGKAGADVHSLFDTIREAINWTPQEAAAHIAGLEAELASGELTPHDEAHKLQEMGLVQLVADWHHADAARRETALSEAKRVFDKGYAEYGIKRAKIAERREAARVALKADTGMAGLKSERDARALHDNGLVGGWKKTIVGLLSFEQAMHWTFGDKSKDAQKISDMERNAAFASQDEVQEIQNNVADVFSRLAGGTYKGEQLRWKLAQKSIKAGGIELSEMEAITATLMWRQPDGRRHMEGKRDENNQVTSQWSYDQRFIDSIEQKLSPEAQAVRAFIVTHYSGEYSSLNKVYRELNGINLPKNPNYSPLTVKPQQAQSGQSVDPITGTTFSTGSVTPGALRTRGVAIAEPEFRDALQVLLAHTKQMAHWKAYAPLTAEAQSLLNSREVGNSVEAKAGEQALSVIRGWLNYFAQGGTRDAAAHLALNQAISRMASRAASVALAGRIGTLVIQSTQLAAGVAEMPTGAYLKRMGLLLSGNMGWGRALASPYIQRRLHAMPPIVREAVAGLSAEKPNLLRHAVQRMGNLISGADALFTAGTFAIVHDYQLGQAREMGLSGDEAEAHALQAAERATDRLAQPTRPGARSLFENTATNPFVRVGWAFASEARKNLGLAAYALAERPLAQKVRTLVFVAVLNSLISAMIRSAWRDLRDKGDDEVFDEKHWGLKRMALTIAVDPFQGIPVFGSMIQSGAFKLAGEWRPTGDLFSSFEHVPPALSHIPDIVTGDRTTEESLRDVDAIISGMGLFNSDIAASASLVHLARDLFGVAQDVKGDE